MTNDLGKVRQQAIVKQILRFQDWVSSHQERCTCHAPSRQFVLTYPKYVAIDLLVLKNTEKLPSIMSSPSPQNTSSYGIIPLESQPYKGSVWVLVPFFWHICDRYGRRFFSDQSAKYLFPHAGITDVMGKDLTLHFFRITETTSANEPQELPFSFYCLHLFSITNSKIFRKRGLSFARTYYFTFLIYGSQIACIFHNSS